MALFTSENVLVPFDFSEASQKALTETLTFVGDPSKLHVLHVIPPLEATEPSVVWETLDTQTRKDNVQKVFSEKFGDEVFQQVHFTVAVGNPSSEIIDYAEQNGIDLIVIPSHGRSGISRFLLGSVAERVIRFAPCPVLVVRR